MRPRQEPLGDIQDSESLDSSGYHKKENRIIFFIMHVHGFKENSSRTQFDIALGTHALRMQPTD